MANLPETPVWETGIYQLEETDPVQGGPNGIDNQQGKQLANRTAWLKSQVETLGTGKQPLDATLTAIAALNGVADRIAYFTGPDTVALTPLTDFIRTLLDDGDASAARSTLGAISQTQLNAAISALVNSSPATLDTLNELAAALGNDANFATTVTNALAAKAPIASPVFTGDPKGPTPAQFDNDTSLATTEFVQRALGNAQGVVLCNTGTTNLAASDAGKAVILTQSGAIAVLPSISSVPNGAAFSFGNGTGGGAGSVQRSGADQIYIGDSPRTSVAVNGGESLTVVKYGGGWFAIGGSVTLYKGSLSFPSSLSANGYQKLPGGLIIQWGISGSVAAGAVVNITLPIAFPNAVLSVTGTPVGASVNSNPGGLGIAASVSALSIYNWGSVLGYTAGVRWIAIGC